MTVRVGINGFGRIGRNFYRALLVQQEKGGADFAIEFTDGVRFRVAVFKQRGNIGMVLRRIPSQFLSFEQLGLPPVIAELWAAGITSKKGIARVLNQCAVRTPRGVGHWRTIQVTRVLARLAG